MAKETTKFLYLFMIELENFMIVILLKLLCAINHSDLEEKYSIHRSIFIFDQVVRGYYNGVQYFSS